MSRSHDASAGAEIVQPPSIRILQASHIYSIGKPIVVLEWRQAHMGALWVDYSILIPQPSWDLIEGRYAFEVYGSEGAETSLLVDSVQECCRSRLQSQIADELVGKQPDLVSLWSIVQLTLASHNVFLPVWIQGQCKGALERLSARVRDLSLRNFLSSLKSIEVTKTER